MRLKLFFLSLVLASFGFFFFKSTKEAKVPYHPITEKKAFVIIIPSYNNSEYVEKNLTSVFSQKYENFRVIYIDDNSRDDTLAKASKFLSKHDLIKRTTLLHNATNYGSLANIYNAVHSCHNHEIVLLLDGDDFLAHDNVLNTLNKAYADPNTWLTYGNYLDYPSYKQNPQICKKLPQKIIAKSLFRKSPWMTSHLRTFYAGLFKEIKIEDLLYRGRFYPMSGDLALMFPLLELAKTHIRFIDEVLYIYNRENPISDHKININFQQECATNIREKPSYTPLARLPSQNTASKQSADLLIFSQDSPLQLYALIESIERYVSGLNKVTVLYEATSSPFESAYLELQLKFPTIHFVKQTEPFKPLLTNILFQSTSQESKYILFARDDLIIKDIIDLSQGIEALDKTGAYGLFYPYHQHLEFSREYARYQPLPPITPLKGITSGEPLLLWQFSAGTDDWNTPSSFHFSLYAKEPLSKIFKAMDYTSLETLEQEWKCHAPENGIGLFYSKGKSALMPPLNEGAPFALLEKFHDGLKIDITPLFQASSPSQEITCPISFIPRD